MKQILWMLFLDCYSVHVQRPKNMRLIYKLGLARLRLSLCDLGVRQILSTKVVKVDI